VIAGLVLAGGRSRRFGAEKALAVVDGLPMLRRIAGLLQPAVAALAVSARAGSGAERLAKALGFPVLHDDPADPEGPLAGVRAGLAWAQGRGATRLLLAPCDTPFLPLTYAASMIASDPTLAAVATAGEEIEPLCSIWPTSLLNDLTAALKQGHPPIGEWLIAKGAAKVAFADAASFRNVNRPTDLD